jgi:hypothetical protein
LHTRTGETNWRARHPVLVGDAHTAGALAVIRSLGRAGYPVIACAPVSDALGFSSRYVRAVWTHPPYSEREALSAGLHATARRFRLAAILPGPRLLCALRETYDDFRPLLPLHSDPAIVYRGLSPVELFRAFDTASVALRQHLPPFCLLDEDDPTPHPRALGWLGSQLRVVTEMNGLAAQTTLQSEPQGWWRELNAVRRHHPCVLIQGAMPGASVGVSLLRWNGDLLAYFMHRRMQETPGAGVHMSWWHPGIYADALNRVRHVDWQGTALLEYRWEARSDRFVFIGLQAPVWDALHLALYAGMDFPRLLLDAFLGHPELCDAFVRGVRSRPALAVDLACLARRLRDRAVPLRARLRSLAVFTLLACDPRVRSELSFPGDREPYWMALRQADA